MARGLGLPSIKIIAASHAILDEIKPACVRAVCYKLFTMGLLREMSKPETDKVSKLLTGARERGEIPWAWIVDDTRPANRPGVWESPDVFSKVVCDGFRLDPWEQQGVHLQIWSEKGTVGGVLAPVLKKYAVTFQVFRGFSSTTLVHKIAQESADSYHPYYALYLGDWDPSGLHMSEVDLPKRLAKYEGNVDFKRIALVSDDLPGLPWFPDEEKIKDPRLPWYRANFGHSGRCWELDAMDPNVLRDRVEAAIVEFIEPDAWDRCALIEKAQKDSLKEFQEKWVSLCTE
jgi:hypothetical protein